MRTPTFVVYEPFLLGVGVVFNLLITAYDCLQAIFDTCMFEVRRHTVDKGFNRKSPKS